MPPSPPTLPQRAAGTLLGLAAAETRAAGRSTRLPPETGLALIQADALLQQPFDAEQTAARWIEWSRTGGESLEPWTRTALEHVALHHSPPAAVAGPPGSAALARSVPIALATRGSPANLVSGTFHLAWLLHPDPRCAWGAVAINVAIARFLAGRRDFLPDVIEALRNNDAPDDLLEAVRQVPLRRRADIQQIRPETVPVVRSVELALWLAWHESRWERGLEWLLTVEPDTGRHAPVAGAVLGARDGEAAIPPGWLSPVAEIERVRGLSRRLVGVESR